MSGLLIINFFFYIINQNIWNCFSKIYHETTTEYGIRKYHRRVAMDAFIHKNARSFDYSTQFANEFKLIDPSKIFYNPKKVAEEKNSSITNIYPLIISNDDIVTVTFSSTEPFPNDWIAAYSPADVDINTVVPVKYSYCNTNVSYLQSGLASLSFNFTNLRADIAFYLIRSDDPVVPNGVVLNKYKSNITFFNFNEQLRPRITTTSSYSKFKLVWRLEKKRFF